MYPKSTFGGFRHALDGIIYCFKTQSNLKLQAIAALMALALALYFELLATEFILLLLTIAGVIVAELINTAIETVVNMVSPEYHPLAKAAKDIAAGAVLIMAIVSVAVGYLLFFHRLFG